jgi:membrane protein implicated in regulation of membrane protease activity
MLWWIWIILGLLLLVMESYLPSGFFVFFLGLAAIFVGLVDLAFPGIPTWAHWFVFVLASALFVVLFRKRMQSKKSPQEFRDMIGEFVVIEAEILAGDSGYGELRGTRWQVKNVGSTPLAAGDRRTVKAAKGFLVEVE